MKKPLVRFAEEKDVPTFVQYTKDTPLNLFDPAIGTYPLLKTLAVDFAGEPALFVPFHPVLVIESLAHKPDISPLQNALAIKAASTTIEELAEKAGVKEVWWMCADESLIEAAHRHGYEVINTKVIRKKI